MNNNQATINKLEAMRLRGLARNLDKNILLRLSDSSWIERHQIVLLTGPTGVGKSFIAQALGHQGCMYGFKTGLLSLRKAL